MDSFISGLTENTSWMHLLMVFAISAASGILVRLGLFKIFRWYNGKKPSVLKEQLLLHLNTPTLFFLPLLFAFLALPYFEPNVFWHKSIEMVLIGNVAWICIALLRAFEEVVKDKFQVNGSHRAKDRKVLTQLRFMKSIAIMVILTLTVATFLWNIPAARQLGETILTSAGVLGIIVGVAAQKSIANLITGFQVAFTQTLKIDDQVVVEGEFGTVEDITLTYVIIKTWDWRRLVLPLNYFNEKPFVNWSVNSRDIINSVFFYVDYTFPVDELRTKFLEVLKESPLWDKKVADLLVTNTDEKSMELRATFSSKNAGAGWNLRCHTREALIAFIQKNHPSALPKYRRMDLDKNQMENDLRKASKKQFTM